jgi:hypothetical protein
MQLSKIIYALDTGTSNALEISLSPIPGAYQAGFEVNVKKIGTASSSTTPTLNVNGLGPKTITNRSGAALQSGALSAGAIMKYIYDGTNFRLHGLSSASISDVEAGDDNDGYVTSLNLFLKRTAYFLADGSAGTSVPSGVDTKVTGITATLSSYLHSGSSFASSSFTCGTKDAGVWFFIGYSSLVMLTNAITTFNFRLSVAKNAGSGPFVGIYVLPASTYGLTVTQPWVVAAGDVIDLRVFQTTDATRNTGNSMLFGMRMGGA